MFFKMLSKIFGKKNSFHEDDFVSYGAQTDTIKNASGRFGYDSSNPIPVLDQQGQKEYLACLRCSCNDPFAYHRLGSYGPGPDGHIIDGYELSCRSKQHRFTVYMDMYHKGPSMKIPDDLTIGKPEGIGGFHSLSKTSQMVHSREKKKTLTRDT